MWKYIFSGGAIKDFLKLSKSLQTRIIKKLDFFISHENPLIFARKLINSDLGKYRLNGLEY